MYPLPDTPGAAAFTEAFAEAKLTGSGLNFRLWCCEKHPRVTMTKPNSLVCLDSCLEVFLNPYPDFTRDYLNFEMNAAGTLLLQKGPDRAHRSFVNLALPHYPQVHAWQLPDVWAWSWKYPLHFCSRYTVPRAPALPQNPVGNFYQRSGPPQEHCACCALLPIPLTLITFPPPGRVPGDTVQPVKKIWGIAANF